jgi:hypothetical protein
MMCLLDVTYVYELYLVPPLKVACKRLMVTAVH